MLILRPIAETDLEALVDLAQQLDSLNLPSDREFLERRIRASLRSFGRPLDDLRARPVRGASTLAFAAPHTPRHGIS